MNKNNEKNKAFTVPLFIDNTKECLSSLKEALDDVGKKPRLINVYVESPDNKESDMGGLGKSLIIRQAWKYLGMEESKQFLIDIAVQYSTRKDILWQVGEALGFVENKDIIERSILEEDEIEQFRKIYIDTTGDNEGRYDPSYMATYLFYKITSHSEVKFATKILFFDSFDEKYLGDDYSPQRQWLTYSLFPYLVLKLDITVLVSGRRKMVKSEVDQKDSKFGYDLNDYKQSILEIPLIHFTEDNCLEFMYTYLERRHQIKGIPQNATEVAWWEKNKKDFVKYKKQICDLTGGKPIFLDFFADFIRRRAAGKEANNMKDIFKQMEIENIEGDEAKEAFKKHLILRLRAHELTDEEFGDMRRYYEAIELLSVARHGLNATDFVQLQEEIKNRKDVAPERVDTIENFFNNSFNQKKLSYVKDIKESRRYKNIGSERRTLHDEVVDLIQRYDHDQNDVEHKHRNQILDHLKWMYRESMDESYQGRNEKNQGEKEKDQQKYQFYNRNHDRFPRLLLEYIDYCFAVKDAGEERNSIHRYLYEFSHYLNRYPDFNTRLTQKARSYYRSKLSETSLHYPRTLTIADHFNDLSKLQMREIGYLLTNRDTEGDWSKRIEEILKENEAHETNTQEWAKIGLRARRAASQGEMCFWQNKWSEGKTILEQSKEDFYRTGDSHGLMWVEHLLGFEAQRGARFNIAERHHRDAFESAYHFSLRLISNAKKEKKASILFAHSEGKEGYEDWLYRYRLRYLSELVNRVNGNLAVRLRYEGRLLEAISVLSMNLGLAQIAGEREVVRNKANLAVLGATIGRNQREYQPNADYALKVFKTVPDPLLKLRVPNMELIHLIKTIALESRTYRKTRQKFRFKGTFNENIARKAQVEIKNKLQRIAEALCPEPAPFFPGAGAVENIWNVFLPYGTADNPYKGSGREAADIYYQVGKLLLSVQGVPDDVSKHLPKEYEDFFHFAAVSFENTHAIARKSRFLYLEMEAAESLFRLSYLSEAYADQQLMYEGLFIAALKTMESNQEEYGVYHDILSRYYITKFDLELDKLFDKSTIIPEMFKAPMDLLTTAMLHAYQHNQERYTLLLDVFTYRIRKIIDVLQRSQQVDEFLEYFLEDILSQTEIYKKDLNLHLYLVHCFASLKMEASGVLELESGVYRKIKKGVRVLMERSKFVRAANINAPLIRMLKSKIEHAKKDELTEDLVNEYAFRCFQQFYCFHGSNRHGRAVIVLDEVKNMKSFIAEKKQNKETRMNTTILESVIGIGEGTLKYRTKEFWNMESFLPGETEGYRLQNKKSIKEAVDDLTAAVNNVFHYINSEKKTALSYFRLLNEGLFRLGEVQILFRGNKIGLDKNLERFIKGKESKIDELGLVFTEDPAILLLVYAYKIADITGDLHRKSDALQSIANVYCLNYTDQDNWKTEVKKNIRVHLEELMMDSDYTQLKGMPLFPIVDAKLYLVEGDIYFSELYKYDKSKSFIFASELNQDSTVNTRRQSSVKSQLHQMMWHYLKALDLLTDTQNHYNNYHFQNLAYEIHRRIKLITEPDHLQMLLEDLGPIWHKFSRLSTKDRILISLEHAIKTHIIACSAREILS